MDASCASRDMSTASSRKFVLQECLREKSHHEKKGRTYRWPQGGARGQSCRAICTPSCGAMRRLPAWAAYRARDDCGRGVVHSRRRHFQDRAVMLGLLGRALVGFAGPDSELQRGGNKKHGNRVRECTLFHAWRGREFFSSREAYHGRPRHPPRALPISRDREACRTLRRLP